MNNYNFIIPFLLICTGIFGQNGGSLETSKEFSLKFYSVGFGSNMHDEQPVFKVVGDGFIYTYENAWSDGNNFFKEKCDTICSGNFRRSSIDSILTLINGYGDSTIYRSTSGIMSGGSDNLEIIHTGTVVRFELINTHDTVVSQIVSILNSYIPLQERKITVFPKDWLKD